ncbi:hypothetical protein ACEQ38_17015 [Ralstonia syzygii subsp. celebesensis]|uniref:hypothetical protein n=1 Tax=Ralstonia syzygii TaxID=28097 RepID=UPI0012FD4717|nr:hypothetical protein [Ralstonia syzygii]
MSWIKRAATVPQVAALLVLLPVMVLRAVALLLGLLALVVMAQVPAPARVLVQARACWKSARTARPPSSCLRSTASAKKTAPSIWKPPAAS